MQIHKSQRMSKKAMIQSQTVRKKMKVEGVKGKFVQARSMNDKYGERPDEIKNITQSQFAKN